jgi:hypothetical protein
LNVKIKKENKEIEKYDKAYSKKQKTVRKWKESP